MRATVPCPACRLLGAAILFCTLFLAATVLAKGDPAGIKQLDVAPTHDTWATHDDGKAHGAETSIKVGIERQACDPTDSKNICTKKKPAQVCCPADALNPAFCAPNDTCATAAPAWTSFRKFRGYISFDLGKVPKGKVIKAQLSMRVGEVKEVLGPPAKVVTTRLKKIGLPNPMCTWDEKSLDDTNGTTWSSLPQNVASAPGQMWLFDVTKAVADWLNGDTDIKGNPIQPNCGFHLHDPDFGNKDNPIERWVLFNSKEGKVPPTLALTIATDGDKDGHFADTDCDDSDPKVNPAAVDVCGDGIDNDCSGQADDEVCDGQDNNCDGKVDEGVGGSALAPCEAGALCANHSCLPTCKDDCAGPTHRKCEWNATDKVWVIWGCAKADADPCWDWKEYEPCNKGQFCQYGSCSSNCVDLCDKSGDKACSKDKLGLWHVGECGNWDNDSCLEEKVLLQCGPGASCKDADCGIDGCKDACKQLGEVTCDGAKAVVCSDSDGDGCLDLNAVTDCTPNACAAPGGCVLPGNSLPTPDAGSTEPNTGAADASGSDSASADISEPADSQHEDTVAATDASDASDASAGDTGALDSTPPPASTPAPEDDGCAASPAGERSSAPLFYLMVAGLVWLWRRSSPPRWRPRHPCPQPPHRRPCSPVWRRSRSSESRCPRG